MKLAPLYRSFQNKTRAKRINLIGLMVCEKNTIQVLVQNQINRITFQLTLFKPDSGVPPSHLTGTNRYALKFVRDEHRALTGDLRRARG